MDGLVSNTSLIAGVGAASVAPSTVVLGGAAGLVAGAFSMALGEYTSVTTQNEQIDKEVQVERRALRRNPAAEHAELVAEFVTLGMSEQTANAAAREIAKDEERELDVHVVAELGIDPAAKPSPYVAAGSSFLMFSIGAVFPLVPYLLGFSSLAAGLAVGMLGLLIVGGLAAHLTATPIVRGAFRQLFLGAIAIGATYAVGTLIDAGIDI
jgi:VIT1/CCC1 family predicted Fe2+/Mn2+ transporter